MDLTTLLLQLPLQLPLDGLPDPSPTAPPGADKVTIVLGWVMWAVAAFCLLMAIVGGGRIAAAHRRGEEAEGFKAVGMPVIGLIIATSAASILTFFVA